MRIRYLVLFISGLAVQNFYSMELFEPRSKPSAKRKLFEKEIREKENQSTPSKKVTVNKGDEIPPTRPETPSTPENIRIKRLADRGHYRLAVQNMSNKPAIVTYVGPKGPSYTMLAPAAALEPGHEDFPKTRLDALVSLKDAPVTIAPTGEHFMRLVLDQTAPHKIVLEQYKEAPHTSGFVSMGDLILNPEKPWLVQLHTRVKDNVFVYTDIDIINK